MDAQAAERAKVRIARMKQEAGELTKALGFPPEATYTVMAAMYEVKTSLAEQVTQSEATFSSETSLKDLVYQLSEDFLKGQMQEQIATFQILWERLKTLSVEVVSELGQRSTASQGIGFTGGQRFQHLLSITSTISWAVLNYSTLRQSDPEQIQAIIAKEAEARGCSRALSNRLARYVQTHAPYTS